MVTKTYIIHKLLPTLFKVWNIRLLIINRTITGLLSTKEQYQEHFTVPRSLHSEGIGSCRFYEDGTNKNSQQVY